MISKANSWKTFWDVVLLLHASRRAARPALIAAKRGERIGDGRGANWYEKPEIADRIAAGESCRSVLTSLLHW